MDDDGKAKHHWLWTTLKGTGDTYDFDSFRVFIYSLKRHRYETAYIERKVVGHYPVEAKAGSPPSFSSHSGRRRLQVVAQDIFV